MPIEKRGLQSVKTMNCLVDRRRIRSSAEALMELSVLANEKQRLHQEMERARRRITDIEQRLTEIADKETRLFRSVKEPPPVARVRPVAEHGPQVRATEFQY